MKAVILAPAHSPELHGLDEHIAIPLLPLCDRPFLQHTIEHLLRQGVANFAVVLSHLPEAVEEYFGDGARWGCQIEYHLIPPEGSAEPIVGRLAAAEPEEVLLGRADCLPYFEGQNLRRARGEAPVLFCRASGEQPGKERWTGWALLPAGAWRPGLLAEAARCQAGGEGGSFAIRYASDELNVHSAADLLLSQRKIFLRRSFETTVGGRQLSPGVWVAHGVSLHPRAQLEAPAYIGPNSRIGAEAQIGPFAAVGDNCMISAHSKVVNSAVCPKTYVGEALEVDGVIIDGNRLFHTKLGTRLETEESFLLSSLAGDEIRWHLRATFDRALAAVLWCLLAPLFALVSACVRRWGGGRVVGEELVQLPAGSHRHDWKRFRLERLEWKSGRARSGLGRLLFEVAPGLAAVVRGQLALVGVRARAAEEIERLPGDRKALYLKTKAGLITEAEVVFGARATEDEIFASESYYGATESFSRDLRLLGLFAARLGRRSERMEGARQGSHEP